MPLSNITEFLLAQNIRGEAIVYQGLYQITTVLPPLTRVTLEQFPLGNDYADIAYQWVLDPLVVSSAFSASGLYGGSQAYSGTMTEWIAQNSLDIFLLITRQEPAQAAIENLTNLWQYFACATFILKVPNESSWNRVKEVLSYVYPESRLLQQIERRAR